MAFSVIKSSKRNKSVLSSTEPEVFQVKLIKRLYVMYAKFTHSFALLFDLCKASLFIYGTATCTFSNTSYKMAKLLAITVDLLRRVYKMYSSNNNILIIQN